MTESKDLEKQVLVWAPKWYCSDQEIVVGDVDYFYIKGDEFSHFDDPEDEEIRAEVLAITHPGLGAVKGIVTGLSYAIHMQDGRRIQVDSEQEPGFIEHGEVVVDDWRFEVEVLILERTGLKWANPLHVGPHVNWTLHRREVEAKYRRLLGVDHL